MKENEYRLLNTWLDKVKYHFAHYDNLDEIAEEDLISLKEIATLVQASYSRFKEEYKTLEKLDIGKNNNVLDFYNDGCCGRLLYMQINEQEEKTIVPNGFHYLTISDFNGEHELSFKNSEIINSRKSITIDNVDSRILDGYLDLFEKYYPIFKLFVDLYENDYLASNRNQYLMMGMDTNNDSLINGLNGIEFNIQNFSEMGNNYIIRLYVDLQNDVNIDYKKSKIIVNDSVKKFDGFGYTEILNYAFENIKFNRSSLEGSNFIQFAENQNRLEQQKVKSKTR